MTPRKKFLALVEQDILRLDDAALDFGIHSILD